eukprot:gb/GECG01016822.1/.p1 GENE.gb/GECG01016822.1/~~gb/GECG01016822.1/.p1  ORF type:complete len:624 (+),score=80.88 gb/GECG01016822.1/:1-1872(+)
MAEHRVVAAAILMLVMCQQTVRTQFVETDPKFADQVEKAKQELSDLLKEHPDLEQIYRPKRSQRSSDIYVKRERKGASFTQNVLFDPCRGMEFNCCNATYGAPEYEKVNLNRNSLSFGSLFHVDENNNTLARDNVRTPDPVLYLAPECNGMLDPFDWCFADGMGRRPFPVVPKCWNFNESIETHKSCRSPEDGSELPFCFELAITQNAYISECGGQFKDTDSCGTFLEVHRPNKSSILTQVRLKGQYTSGYAGVVISSIYKKDENKILCRGDYEMWWVHKTPSEFIVEKQLPFRISEPACDWDAQYNKEKPWRTITNDSALDKISLGLFERSTALFTRERVHGRRGVPGPGMGGTLVLPQEDTYPSNAIFSDTEFFTYSFFDQLLPSDIKDGELYPSHPQFDERERAPAPQPSPSPRGFISGETNFEVSDKAKATSPPAYEFLSSSLRRRLQATYIPKSRLPPPEVYKQDGRGLLEKMLNNSRYHSQARPHSEYRALSLEEEEGYHGARHHTYSAIEAKVLLSGEIPHKSKVKITRLHRGTAVTKLGNDFLEALQNSRQRSIENAKGRGQTEKDEKNGDEEAILSDEFIQSQRGLAEELRQIGIQKAEILREIRRKEEARNRS